MKKRKTWTKEEKLAALGFLKTNGVSYTTRKFGVSATSLYKWRDKFEEQGSTGFDKSSESHKDQELRALKRELEQYKAMVAERDLTIRIQNDMLKKSH